ncbi:MAG: hypothetical protein KF774_04580 [Planctomyces sp.]|nr:hypothetical protein [Planctomyces sp.]
MHPITLAATTGRCGTTFLERSLQLSYGEGPQWISHEHLRQNVTQVAPFHRSFEPADREGMLSPEVTGLLADWRRISETAPVVDFGWTMRSLIPWMHSEIGDQLRVIHLHRHPVAVAASFKLIGSYSDYQAPNWALTPSHPRALFPQFQSRWGNMGPFEKCLYLWLEANAFARELPDRIPGLQMLDVRSESLFKSPEVLRRVAQFTGFADWRPDCPLVPSEEKNERAVFCLERRPLGEEWKTYQRHPEVIELAEAMGYDMSPEFVGASIHKYQLPDGWLPLLRNRSGYWVVKERVGKLLRQAGLRK